MSEIAITAAICSHDRYKTVGEAIESLNAQTLDRNTFEIIVIDNSPDTDFSKAFGRNYRHISNLTWVHEKIPGLSNARNVGAGLAKGRFIAYMDDDAVADASWLSNVLATFETFGDRTGAVGGRVDPIWDAPRPKWLGDNLLGYLSVVNLGGDTRILGEQERVVGTNISFRVETLQSTGGFSTNLGRTGPGYSLLSNDETEVCARLKSAHHLVAYAPEARVQHHVVAGRLTQEWFRRRVVWQAISDYYQNGAQLFDQAPLHWKGVVEFVNLLSPRDRSPRAFHVPMEEPQMFEQQMNALYSYTICLLAGFKDIEA